jgi:hypothetical protein
MIFSILLIFLSLLLLTILISHIQVFDLSSRFSSAVINLLLVVGLYALFITGLKSIFSIPILGIVFIGIVWNKIRFRWIYEGWQTTILTTISVSLIFLLVYFRNNELLIPSEDYLFWIRVGLSNQKFGVENINVFYNLIDSSFNKADFYHYFELWIMDLACVINKQSAALNLFFFAYPLALILSCIGIIEFLVSIHSQLSTKYFQIILSVLFFVAGFLFFTNPWDTLINLLGFGNMPISGIGFVWKGLLKMVYVLNIVIGLFLYLNRPTLGTLLSLVLLTFFYLPVFPILMLSLFLWHVYLWIQSSKVLGREFLLILFFSIGVMFFYVFFGNHTKTTISSFSIKEWFTVKGWLKFTPAILMKSFIIPIIFFFPVYFLLLRKKINLLSYKPLQFIILIYFISIGVWGLFVKNIDANQAFLLLFGSILPLLMLYLIWNLFLTRKIFLATVLAIIYIIPGFIYAVKFNSPIKKESVSTINFLKSLNNSKVLYLPHKSELNSIYDYNEKVYTKVNQFIIYNSSIELISISASFLGENKEFSSAILPMYNFYKESAPYYKKCGFVDVSSECFLDFLKENKIDIVCTKDKDLKIQGWNKVFSNSDYDFYKYRK